MIGSVNGCVSSSWTMVWSEERVDMVWGGGGGGKREGGKRERVR